VQRPGREERPEEWPEAVPEAGWQPAATLHRPAHGGQQARQLVGGEAADVHVLQRDAVNIHPWGLVWNDVICVPSGL
jgi:hypothetical protein